MSTLAKINVLGLVKSEPKLGLDTPGPKELASGLVGGAAGAILWKDHRYLGFNVGSYGAQGAYALLKKDYSEVAKNVILGGASTYVSLMWKKHPFLGWLAGTMIGGAACSLLPESKSEKE